VIVCLLSAIQEGVPVNMVDPGQKGPQSLSAMTSTGEEMLNKNCRTAGLHVPSCSRRRGFPAPSSTWGLGSNRSCEGGPPCRTELPAFYGGLGCWFQVLRLLSPTSQLGSELGEWQCSLPHWAFYLEDWECETTKAICLPFSGLLAPELGPSLGVSTGKL